MSREAPGPTRAVLFDYGLTLVTFSFPRDCLLELLRRRRPEIERALGSVAPSAEDILARVLAPLEDMLDSLGDDEIDYLRVYGEAWRDAGLGLPADLLYRILDDEQRCWETSVRVAPDAFPLLRRLRGRGLRTGICSNAPFPPELMHRQVRENGLAAAVDTVVFSSEIGRRKPAPELFHAALERLGTRAEETLFVGDRLREDYEGARAAGLRAVLSTELAGRAVPDGVPAIGSLAEVEACL